jgi:hypothetical protein
MLNRFKIVLSIATIGMIALMISCSKSGVQNNASLFNHWKFVGFIDSQNNFTQVSLHTDCDSCMSLFFSSPDKYFGRAYLRYVITTFDTVGNKLVLGTYNTDLLFDIGVVENKFHDGIGAPNTWNIENNHLTLTTTAYSDKLLFIAK